MSNRWTPRRKMEITHAIRGGFMTFEDVCRDHAMAPEELQSWLDASSQGFRGNLRVRNLANRKKVNHGMGRKRLRRVSKKAQ